VLSEIWDYCQDEAGEIVKVNDHFLDACVMRYFPMSGRGLSPNEPIKNYFFVIKQENTAQYWTCSITRLVIEQVSQNAPHFAVFLAVVV
jgi:hypothetical protein